MKKLLLCAAIAAFGLSSVNAQGIKLGIKAGANFASLSGDDVDDLDGRTSLHVGAAAKIGISDKFALQPELVYSAQGFSYSEAGFDSTGKLDYINIPVLADFTIIEGLSVQAGPQIGFVINDEEDYDDGETEDIGAESIDFGALLGAQFKLENGLFFQARYNLGLSDVISDVDAKNNVFSLSVGYFIF
ncbi:porin family protein [Flavivirga rizhaonensis]|uniref:PorT family protein n=1 Tax=Flavivirga rizhaonensis TaxID=2559571 RepID=A0A4S1DZ82_9FLAO|nr:porin family protein [Flavivirga rizhaonensis]TGV03315.1 PorT family protein [Flavivirga rizhaonensis]